MSYDSLMSIYVKGHKHFAKFCWKVKLKASNKVWCIDVLEKKARIAEFLTGYLCSSLILSAHSKIRAAVTWWHTHAAPREKQQLEMVFNVLCHSRWLKGMYADERVESLMGKKLCYSKYLCIIANILTHLYSSRNHIFEKLISVSS